MYFPIAIFASALLVPASGSVLSSRSLSGEATYYGGDVAGGACSFSTYTLPSGVLGSALSDSNWDGSGNCGACVSVTGPDGNSITAMIVDECPGCGTNHLDLFPNAFSSLADPVKGIIPITWDYVDCPITTPLQVHNKEGVSAYWFSMQVVNANKRVKSLEVSTDGGSSWQSTARQDYNFFENSMGFGTTTVDVKVTSVDGDVVIVKSVGISSGSIVTASSNFGSTSGGAVSSVAAAPVKSTSAALPEKVVETPTTTANVYPTVAVPADSSSVAPTSLPGAIFEGHSTSTSFSTFTNYITTSFPKTTTYLTTTTISKTKTKCASNSKPAYTHSHLPFNSTLSSYPTATVGTVKIPSSVAIPTSIAAPSSITTPTTIEIPSSSAADQTGVATATLSPVPFVSGATKTSSGAWNLLAVVVLTALIAH